MIIVWDSITCAPIKTISNPHENGIVAISISPEASILATLSNEEEQHLSIWNWTDDSEVPMATGTVESQDRQTCLQFNDSNPYEMVTNGQRHVIFWNFFPDRGENGELTHYAPPVAARDFKHGVGVFTQTLFLPGTQMAVSATVEGDLVLWEPSLIKDSRTTSHGDRRAVKVIRIKQDAAITYITSTKKYLVTGGEDGDIRFYDFQLRLIAWFEDLDAGAVTSISFAQDVQQEEKTFLQQAEQQDDDTFTVPDFIVATNNALVILCTGSMFQEMDPNDRRGQMILQAQDAALHGLTCYPKGPLFACTGYSGALQIWNYEEKRLEKLRQFDKLLGQCLSYDNSGEVLAMGCTNGALIIIDAETLEDIQVFRQSKDCITELVFSSDGKWIATADADLCTAIFHYTNRNEDPTKPEEWVYIGKFRGHHKPITGLQFVDVADQEYPRLFSIGEDRMMQEYDLINSHITSGLAIKDPIRVEQTAVPTSMFVFSPKVFDPKSKREDEIVVASDQYKFKVWSTSSKRLKRTFLGVTYGGPLNSMCIIPGSPGPLRYLAYTTHDKVVGVIKLPLDGNPHRAMGMIAHPGEISGISCSYDGRYLFSAGGADFTINQWELDYAPLEAQFAAGGEGREPFVQLIEGGENGEFYREIIDYFYYAQLRSQGENTTQDRHITGTVPLSEVPNLMRALGFYPTNREIEAILEESKFSKYDETGQYVTRIDMDEFVRLYVNHRPVFGIGKEQIAEAFAILGSEPVSGYIERDLLLNNLEGIGESFTEQELISCLSALIGDMNEIEDKIDDQLTAKDFAEEILGFEDYDQDGVYDSDIGEDPIE
eukprot:TRINITY_DN10213_c0_g1_i2.p1 TRINITY_DN10213_c0_g1~~TRINITY_DN10213_c0_g1_i2.p1  ORF type:complete len:827 (-),score=176.13 TRINITY_DN10213_c0_g1_i2:228-2708(-)